MPVGQDPSSGSILESLLYSDIRIENVGYDPSGERNPGMETAAGVENPS